MSSTQGSDADGGVAEVRRAGVFDIRNFIAGLIGFYGVVLVVYGIVGGSEAQSAKSDGLDINVWAGLGMLAVAVGFVAWARLRPVIVAVEPDDQPQETAGH